MRKKTNPSPTRSPVRVTKRKSIVKKPKRPSTRKKSAKTPKSHPDPKKYYDLHGKAALDEVVCFDGVCRRLVLKRVDGNLRPRWEIARV
jgi:hypothetical protein